jgi:D-sedoheptulose 7-phosphate isomerase
MLLRNRWPGKLKAEIAEALELKGKLLTGSYLALIEKVTGEITRALRRGRKVLLCGNGGSAADCQHWAAEMLGRFLKERPALPFISVTTNTSTLTSIANDYDFGLVFSRQIEALAEPGDILLCFSTSGASRNVLKAARTGRSRKMKVISLTGQAPNPLARISDLSLAVPSRKTPRIQEIHVLLIHLICGLVEETLFK